MGNSGDSAGDDGGAQTMLDMAAHRFLRRRFAAREQHVRIERKHDEHLPGVFVGGFRIFAPHERDVLDLADLHAAEIDLAASVQAGNGGIAVCLRDEFLLVVAGSSQVDERAYRRHRGGDEDEADLRIVCTVFVSHLLPPRD